MNLDGTQITQISRDGHRCVCHSERSRRSHVRPPHALREMSRQARHDRHHSSENKNL